MKIFITTLLLFSSISLLNAQVWLEEFQEKENVNFNDIVKVANQHFDTVDITEKGSGFKQYKRFEWFWSDRVMPDGSFPNLELLTKGIYHSTNDKLNKTQSSNKWRHLGPYGANGGYSGIGRVNCVRVNPHNGDIWAGTPSGGIWTSSNNGSSWSTNTDDEDIITSLGVTSIAFHPSNSNIIYAATGDGDGTNTYSYGVIKSTDGGDSWKATGLSWNITQLRSISKLLINNSNPNILYIAGSSGVYKTTNSGDNWDLVKSGNFKDMEFKPNDYETIYVAGRDIWKTTDGGTNWNELTNGVPTSGVRRIAIAVSKNSSDALYALYGNSSGNNLKGVYLSTNSGTSFTEIADSDPNMMGYSKTGDDTKGQVWYDLCIEADQDDWKKVIIGGVNLWRTTDAGDNWEISSMWSGNHNNLTTVHADQHDLWYDDTNNKMYVGNDGSVYSSDDFGKSWDWIGSGILATQFYRFGISQLDSSLYIAGAQDNGTKVKKAGGNWVDKIGGDGFDAVIDHENKNIMYGSLYYGDYFKSTNGGNSFKRINDTNNDGDYDDIDEKGAWSAPLILNPKNSNSLLLGMNNVWISSDGGDNFTKISNLNYNNNKIVRLAMSDVDTNIIYAAFNSRLYKTTDYGSNWSQMTRPGNTNLSYIFTDDADSEKLWATNSRYSSGNKVFESTDGGITWSNISLNLPNIPALTIVKQKGTDDRLWLGTDVGVYYKDDNMSEWKEYNDDLPNVIVTELEINSSHNQLYASTYGRGIWKVDIPTSLNSPNIIDPLLGTIGVKTSNLLIDWNSVIDADNYIIEISENEDFSSSFILDTVNISRYVTSNLDYNKKYYVKLKSLNLYTQSDWSSAHNFTTVVGRVQLLNPTNNKVAVKFTDELTWKELEGATGYELIVSDKDDFSSTLKNINTSELSSVLNTNLDLALNYNTNYWWKVRATNSGVESPDWSFTRSFETYLDSPNIISPIDDSEDIDITTASNWSTVNGADEYEIIYYEIDDAENVTTEKTDKLSFTLSNLKSYTRYGLFLYALKNGNRGAVSDTIVFTTKIGKLSLVEPPNNTINTDLDQTFSWSSLDYATEYEIEFDIANSFDTQHFNSYKVNETGIDESLLLYDTTYYWRVSAFVGNKKGLYSDVFTFRTKLEPTDLIFPENNTNEVSLDTLLVWRDIVNSDYQLQVASDVNFNSIVLDNLYSGNTAEISSLNYYSNYYWRVRVKRDEFESDWSQVNSFKTKVGVPNLILPNNDTINQLADTELRWENVSYAQEYDIQIDTTIEFNSPLLLSKTQTSNFLLVTDLLFDQVYYWKTRLKVNGSISDWSEIYSFRTELVSPLLFSPSNNSVEVNNDGNLEWSDNSNATRYRVQLSETNQFNNLLYDESVSGQEFSYSGLLNDKTYYWRVKATRNDFESAWSDIFTFNTPSTIDRPILTVPANLSNNLKLDQIELKWNELNDVEKYEINIALDSTYKDLYLLDDNIEQNNYVFTPDLYSQSYYWKVRGIRSNNTSEWSDNWRFSTTLPTLELISPANNSNNESLDGILVWKADEKAKNYSVELSKDISFTNPITEYSKLLSENQLAFSNLEDDTKYYWRVKSKNNIAESEWSDVWNFTTNDSQSSIKIENSNTTISVFPNPIKDNTVIRIETKEALNIKLTLTDLNGQNIKGLFNSNIYNNEVRNLILGTKDLSKGAYILIVETENSTNTIKVIVH